MYGTSDRLPSYSPSASSTNNSSYGNDHVAPKWPATFDEGTDLLMVSPVTPTSPEQGRLLGVRGDDMGHGSLHHGVSSFYESVFNAINLLLGVGVLASPFALRSSGWIIGVPLFLFFSLVTNHTGKLLGKCLGSQEGMMTYPDIGEAAYGTKGRIMISVIFFTELFTICAMFDILIGDTLEALFPAFTSQQLLIIAFLCIMPTLWTAHLSILSWFSLLGVFSSVFCLYVILYVGYMIDYTAPNFTMGSFIKPQHTELISDFDRIPLSIGLTMVAFGGHSVFPSICSSMANKADYPRVLDIAYIVAVTVYGVIGIGGYLMFGTMTSKEITLNLIAVYPGALTTLMIWMIAVNPMTKVPITIHPIALALEELLLTSSQLQRETQRIKIYRAFIRTTIGIGTVACGIYIPYFARLISFIGAFFAIFTSVSFPCLCYLKLFYPTLSTLEKIVNISLTLVSVVFAIIGTMASFWSPAD